MELNMNDIKDLTSIPKEYIYDSKTIEYLYQSNPNVFNSVNEYLNLSFEFQEKITQLINNGTNSRTSSIFNPPICLLSFPTL